MLNSRYFRTFPVLKAGNSLKKYAKGSYQKEKFPQEGGNFSNHENLESYSVGLFFSLLRISSLRSLKLRGLLPKKAFSQSP